MKRKAVGANRKFSEAWTSKYFFVEQDSRSTCLICNFTISVCKEYNIKRHYETKHSECSKLEGEDRNRRIEFLRRSFVAQRNVFTKASAQLDNCVEVSLEIAAIIAKSGRPFTDGDFAKQCILLAAEKLCPEATNKFKNVSLSRMTIQRRIENLSDDINEQLQIAATKFKYFSLAADESTDNTSTAQLLLFVRGISENFEVTEELVGMSSMKGRTTGADILTSILNLCSAHNFNNNKLVSITTDGAPAMIGVQNGMVSLLRNHLGDRGKDLLGYHCIIHQEQLCAKELGFDRLMKAVSDAINFIRSHGLNHRQFKEMLEHTDASHSDLLYYCEVRWLSRGEALKRFADLIDEIIPFLEERGKQTRMLNEISFKCDLAFLVDVTAHLNDLSKKLMGKNQFVNQMANAVSAFKLKLQLFSKQLSCQNFINFPYLMKLKEKVPDKPLDYSEQINKLLSSFEKRFTDFESHTVKLKLFGDPFSVPVQEAPENVQMELIDLQTSDLCKSRFRDLDILDFYKTLPDEFLHLKDNASICATMFGSTYICEQTFSLMNLNKSKLRNQLTDQHLQSILRISTTSFEHNIPKIVGKIQSQPSH